MRFLLSCLRWLHLAAGLVAGIYVFAIGLSGAALVFREEMEALEQPAIHRAAPPGQLTATDVLSLANRQFPEWRVLSINFPNNETPYWMAYLLRGAEAREAYADPGGTRFLAVVNPKQGWSGWLADFHFNLLGGRSGRLVNGYGALALLFLAASGLVLWLPRSANKLGSQLAARLRVSSPAGSSGFWWQVHHLAGIGCVLFLAVMAASGAYFVWTRPFIGFAALYLGRAQEPVVPTHASRELLPIGELARLASNTLPGRPIQRIQVVTQPNQPVRVTLREGDPAEFHLVSTVFLDPVTGAVLAQTKLADRPAGDVFLSWLSAVHFGVFGGWPVRIVWFILALGLPVLAASGFLLWMKRRRTRP